MVLKENNLRLPYAVYVITKHGVAIAKNIQDSMAGVDLFVSPKFIKDAPPGSKLLSLPMDKTMRENFQKYDCHIFIISVGAVVRMIAPLLENKKVDPAVICVDDKAKFSICVLSGHIGRGNFFTGRISEVLSSIPVITTASDVAGTLTVDILGRDLGWKLENQDRNVTRACAAVVNETRVLFVQECGEPNWWPVDKKLPTGVEYATSLEGVNPEDYEILLIASDRANIRLTHPHHYENAIIFHPQTLVLGLGSDRDVEFTVVENGIKKVLIENGLAIHSVKAIASVDKKANEKAFVQIAEKYNWEFITYPAEELDVVEGISSVSAMAKKYAGTRSVSEAASLLASGASELLVPKNKYKEEVSKNMTVAISRILYPHRQEELLVANDVRSEKS